MTTPSEFWDNGTPEERYNKEIPPRISEEALHDWESKHGVSLPTTLVNALKVQNGGYVSGTGNSLGFESIEFFLPLNSERWAHVEDEEDGSLIADRSKQFVIGDNQGCAVVLDYNDGPEPRVLSIWHGMGAVLRDDDEGTFDEFLQSVRDAQSESESEEEEEDEDEDEEST
jgi:hypothetical protein